MVHDERVALVDRFFSGTGGSYDLMVNLATFGIDRRWKRTLVQLIPEDAHRILDLACGTGISTLAIADGRPQAEITGVELRDEYLAVARNKTAQRPEAHVHWVLSRAEEYRSPVRYDCVTSSYLAKYADLPRLVEAATGWLRPGGRFIAHDFTFPPRRELVWTWRLYFLVLRRLGPLFPAWREIYRGLPELIERSRWVEELQDALSAFGFRDIRRRDLTLYGSAVITAARGD